MSQCGKGIQMVAAFGRTVFYPSDDDGVPPEVVRARSLPPASFLEAQQSEPWVVTPGPNSSREDPPIPEDMTRE